MAQQAKDQALSLLWLCLWLCSCGADLTSGTGTSACRGCILLHLLHLFLLSFFLSFLKYNQVNKHYAFHL